MRVLIWILILHGLLPGKILAQQLTDEKVSAMGENNDAYIDGLILYDKGYYAKAENKFRQAFALHPNTEVASYLYYAMILQGKDLQASVFQKKNVLYASGIPVYKKGFENIYTDVGPRLSANSNAGNMY